MILIIKLLLKMRSYISKMEISYCRVQPNHLTSRTAIEAEILFAVRLSKKQALTGGKDLACYLFISYLYLFNYLCNNK